VSAETPPPPQVSPDGKFYWDGERWVPMQTPLADPAPVAQQLPDPQPAAGLSTPGIAPEAVLQEVSRLQAEVGLRERFGAALGVTIDEWMAAATPEQRARYLPLIQAHRAGARIEFATDGHIVGWWEGKTFHPFAP
jgi:hypothetical protein